MYAEAVYSKFLIHPKGGRLCNSVPIHSRFAKTKADTCLFHHFRTRPWFYRMWRDRM